MKYYLCIVGNFDGNEQIYLECVDRGIYQFFDATHQKGPASEIRAGDMLLLTTNKQLKGYGIAAGPVIASDKGHDAHWHTIQIRSGWQLLDGDKVMPLPYGVFWNTIRGTKQSIVKEMDSKWTTEILLRLKQLRKEHIGEHGFPIYLAELATGLNTPDPFYRIPDIQRGLVWNATRCEVLWDSILRGIPIGAISVRPTPDGRWEIFDGQQRSNASAMGYAPWPAKEKQSILWIDLKPKEPHGRKYVLMVTTPAHPWGYKLSDDEKADNRLPVWEQRFAVEMLKGAWKNCGIKGARPDTTELWPIHAGLPVPFSLLRQYIEEQPEKSHVEYAGFLRYCIRNYASCNWIRLFHTEGFSESESVEQWISNPPYVDLMEPFNWQSIVEAIRTLSDYTVVALNCEKVQVSDLGLYFKRMNKQGIEPDDEEIRYSMLKSKIPSLKGLDSLAKRTRPAWLADIAIKFWLSKQDGWKWKTRVTLKDFEKISKEKETFTGFVIGQGEKDFPQLLKQLDNTLLQDGQGLLSWHLTELYKYGQGENLVLYFLRELYLERPTDLFIALATTILWFGNDIPQCAESLWNSDDTKKSIFSSIQNKYLSMLFDKNDLDCWAATIKEKLTGSDWGNGENALQDPWTGPALSHIWDGFHGGAGCSFLLFACREFIKDCFADYDIASAEWREQNRPWDYDHILPRSWVEGKRVSGRTYLVKKFLWSIGNSAPLPLSMNRGKNASAPNNYPDNSRCSAKHLHVAWDKVNQFGEDRKGYSYLGHDPTASTNFVCATLDRIVSMLKEWYEVCGIERLLSLNDCDDPRRPLFEKLQKAMCECREYRGAPINVWFVYGAKQYAIRSVTDWARPWLACGICGRIQYKDQKVQCMLGVASDGKDLEIGIRRHPNGIEIPGGEWWLNDEVETLHLADDVTAEEILGKLRAKADSFSPDSDMMEAES